MLLTSFWLQSIYGSAGQARLMNPAFRRGLNRCGKTQKFSVIGGKHPSGPKGPVDFIGVMRGLKPPPPSV
jgi:hypothetical protein